MKARKLLALIAAFAVVFALAMPALAADGDLIVDLAREMDFFTGGGADGEYFRQAGSPTKSAENGGLKLSDRSANWNALDILCDWMEAGKTYTVIVEVGTCDTAQEVILGQSDDPWAPLAGPVAVGPHERATLTFQANGADFASQNIRILTTDVYDDYIIYSAKVYEGNPPAGGGDVPAAPAAADNPRTGENTAVFAAGAALIIAAGALFIIRKKAQA